ncbi:MFS transporter [Streptomyces ardesiacus]|uniref:MFS transporter n=1 Tax=Streptomyces ardesiacus TaxID=285564 RepID=UPI0006E29593|nr:MFS transporter [Streptomyces sp. NBRC 110030]
MELRRLLPLGIGTFAIGTDLFVTAGLVLPIARDLDVSVAAVGQLATVFAVAYAVLSPVLAATTARFTRRQVLLVGLAVFTVANVFTALAPTLGLVLATRVLAAAGAALYTPTASATASALVAPERRGRALAVVLGGLSVATALGSPVGTWIGGTFDWRVVFWLIAGLGAVATAAVAATVPDVRLPQAPNLRARLTPLADRAVLAALVTQALTFSAGYTLYTYLGPALGGATGGSAGKLTAVIWVWGLAAVVGIVVAGRLTDRYGPRAMIFLGIAGIAASVALTPLADLTFPGALVWAAVWSVMAWPVTMGQQHRVITAAPASAPLALGLLSSAQYLGTAVGGLAGGLAVNFAGGGAIGWTATGFALLALAFTAFTYPRSAPAASGAPAEPGAPAGPGAPAEPGAATQHGASGDPAEGEPAATDG